MGTAASMIPSRCRPRSVRWGRDEAQFKIPRTEAFDSEFVSALRSVTVSIWTATALFWGALAYGHGVTSMSAMRLILVDEWVPRTASPRICARVPVDVLLVRAELAAVRDASGRTPARSRSTRRGAASREH